MVQQGVKLTGLAIILLAVLALNSCTSIGLARFPSKDKLFVSTSTENGFILSGSLDYPYQPVGIVAIQTYKCTPCFFINPLDQAYTALEESITGELAQKAAGDYGADGIIQVRWQVVPFVITSVGVSGIAVKKK
jgi:hypothetical protein